jgi:hypothetical protein
LIHVISPELRSLSQIGEFLWEGLLENNQVLKGDESI